MHLLSKGFKALQKTLGDKHILTQLRTVMQPKQQHKHENA